MKKSSSSPAHTFIGVDGCPGGWVAIELSTRGYRRARSFECFADVLAACEHATSIAVDIPIGLLDREDRKADIAAREFLVGQASSVFPAPPRAALSADSFASANEIARRIVDRGLSQQTYALFPKIREVDACIADERIHEVHPEVSFRVLNGGVAMLDRKKTWNGMHARRRRLADAGIVLPDELGEIDPAHRVGIDDIIDAAIAAWTARRIARGQARSFPAEASQKDASGHTIAIWA
jgi:predicted RNase H-like nuclease